MMADPDRPRLIGEVAAGLGMSARHYDSYALVGNLPGTGGIVRPGAQRDLILSEMRLREVDQPEKVLDLPSTALVKLRMYTNPCDVKDEILDLDVELSTECVATDLTEGIVFESKLREMAVLDGRVRTSEDKAIGGGDIVILPTSYTKKPERTPLKGVVVGGARLKEEQGLGLRINPEYRHVIVTKAIEKAINARFFFQDSNKQKLVAEGKNDWFIAAGVVPKYKYDAVHYMSVILSTGFAETAEEQQERLKGCRRLLLNRETARRAAYELEAIGNEEATNVLMTGLNSTDPEIRFYAAYSLAYLDRKECIPVLMELARYEPAFRPLCLVGLSINDDSMAREALEDLMQETEPELRYGAFWAIRHRNPTDKTVVGEKIATGSTKGWGFQFSHVPSSNPLLVVSLQNKQEVVLFGNSTAITLTSPISPTARMTLTPVIGDQIKMTKRHATGEVLNSVVASDIISVLKGIATIQGNYNDVVHTLDLLSNNHCMVTPVALNPRPFAGREYVRKQRGSTAASDDQFEVIKVDKSSLAKTTNTSLWWSPTSWWKSSKDSSKSPTTESATESTPTEMTEEELSAMLSH